MKIYLFFTDECILLETQVVCKEIPLYIAPRGVLSMVAANPAVLNCPLQVSLQSIIYYIQI